MADKSINFSWTNNIENKTLAPGSVVLDKTRGNLHIKSDSVDCIFESKKSHYLANYTWDQIANLCKTGEAASMFKIGDIKPLHIKYQYGVNNNVTEEQDPCAVLVGINHDTLATIPKDYNAGKSTACLTFQLRHYWPSRVALSSNYNFKGTPVDYSSTNAYKLLTDGTFLTTFEEGVKKNIKEVYKKCVGETTPRSSSSKIYTPDNVNPSLETKMIKCKLFEPSLSELHLTTNTDEGLPYEYYLTISNPTYAIMNESYYYQSKKSTIWSDRPLGTFFKKSLSWSATRVLTRSLDYTYFTDATNNTYAYDSRRYYLPYVQYIYSISPASPTYPHDFQMCVSRGMLATHTEDTYQPFIFFCL